MIVVEQNAGLRIDRDINIRPAVVVEIVGDRSDRVSWAGFENAGFLGDIGESSVAVVVVKDIGVAGESARTAHHRDALPLADRLRRRFGSFRRIELDVVADEKIEMSVAVVVEQGAARTPANMLLIDAGLLSDVGERSVAVIVEQNVVSPEAAEQVVPAIVVVVADADAGLPAGARQAGFFGNVGESAVAVVLVKMRCRCFPGRPVRVEPGSVGQINVKPSVVVVIEKSQAAAFGFDDVLL